MGLWRSHARRAGMCFFERFPGRTVARRRSPLGSFPHLGSGAPGLRGPGRNGVPSLCSASGSATPATLRGIGENSGLNLVPCWFAGLLRVIVHCTTHETVPGLELYSRFRAE